MIVLVCGGRDYPARQDAFSCLDSLHAQYGITGIVEGEARGADTLAKEWAIARGVTLYPHRADWDTHGKKAGHLRNAAMLNNNPPPTYCVAFPGGRGTADMVSKAKAAGLVVWLPYLLGESNG